MLLNDVMKLADANDPPCPMYLEASAAGRPVYQRFGWEVVPGEGNERIMVRRGPKLPSSSSII
jgi:hypothetical protein